MNYLNAFYKVIIKILKMLKSSQINSYFNFDFLEIFPKLFKIYFSENIIN